MSVRVVIRCRPLNLDERRDNSKIVVRMNDNEVQVIDSLEGTGGKFYFDEALWSAEVEVEGSKNPNANQDAVYKPVAFELINHVITGYNGCIFAYGQTGSGKTYSMMGTPTDIGLIPRIAKNIFLESANLADNGIESCIEVSFFEIYNEKVRCLLCPADNDFENSTLRVREHPTFGPFIEGLTKFVVSSEQEFLQLMRDGNKVRTSGSTAMNASSSRSHAVFAVSLTQKRTNGRLVTTKISKLNLVDLAGSERASKTMATGKRLVEGANINKSLTCLGNVISSLAEEQESGRQRHIPYRDSVLTWILKDNLGGNSKTVMLATISPSSTQYDETMSTLRYAERAKKIVNKAVVNESNNNEVIAALQKEIEILKQQLQGASEGEKVKLSEELAASEAFQKELQMSLEEKLAETKRVMEEREAYMLQLEEQLKVQRDEIKNLRHDNAEKEKQIEKLLQHIGEVKNKLGNQENTEVQQLLEQVALLETEQHASKEKKTGFNNISSRTAEDTTLRTENLGNVRPQNIEGDKVTVRALAKAFENIGTEKSVVKRELNQKDEIHYDPVALKVRNYEGKGQSNTQVTDDNELLLEFLDDDINQDKNEENINIDEEVEFDLEENGDEDIILDNDIEFDLDIENNEIDQGKDDENYEKEWEASVEDIQLDDDKEYDNNNEVLHEDSLEIEEDLELDVYEEGFISNSEINSKVDDDFNKIVNSKNNSDEKSNINNSINVPSNINTNTSETPHITSSSSIPVAASDVPLSTGLNSITPSVTTLVVPSHALPNNRYLFETFKVIKKSDSVFMGNKKDRIWVADFFRRRFANLDMSGYMSFEHPASNLYRVEKDPVNSRRLTLQFFEAPHPYELEFTSSDRRQRFYEVSMTLRRNSIMWCPSLCPEGENDVILSINGTTIERPDSKIVKVTGETRFMVARMPYEVVDMWYGCFSIKGRPLPNSAAVLGSFLPRDSHEVYIIGVMDVPNSLLGNEELSKYFLEYLGPSLHYVLANTAVYSKKRQINNTIIIIVRRSFIVRTSHIEAMETSQVCKDEISKGDFTAVGCALRINEASIGIILINAKPVNCAASPRSGYLRVLMSNFPFGDTSVDIGSRFDYFIVSGAFNFGADFRDDDMLLAQIKVGNLMSDMIEASPTAALIHSPEPIRIFYLSRPRVCRIDIKQYTTSRALTVPNAFISADIFCQRAFLNVFGEQIQRVQLVFDNFVLSSPNRRIPPVFSPEIRISSEWINGSPLIATFSKNGDTYTLSGNSIPLIAPTISNIEFLRLQTIHFSMLGLLESTKKQQKSVIASGVLPLKNMFNLGKSIEFSIPVFFRACQVGILTGTLLLVAYERDTVHLAGFESERNVLVVSCYENQIMEGKNWVPTVFSQHHAYSFSRRDATIECSRESYELPNISKWAWLSLWRHDIFPHDAEGWTYSEGFDQPFHYNKFVKSCIVRRRRWTRVMQATDPLTVHHYLMELNSNGESR